MLTNVKKENVRPASVDLQLGSIYLAKKSKLVRVSDLMPEYVLVKLPYKLKPGEYVLAKTIESIDQKKKSYGCFLSARSRAFRAGLHILTNFFGPYYAGEIVFGIQNISRNVVELRHGDSLVQIVFTDIRGETKPVSHDFNRGKLV